MGWGCNTTLLQSLPQGVCYTGMVSLCEARKEEQKELVLTGELKWRR